jgi:hypothetical protein
MPAYPVGYRTFFGYIGSRLHWYGAAGKIIVAFMAGVMARGGHRITSVRF